MRILFLSDLLAYGGASKLIFDILPRMTALGHECEVLILTDSNAKYIDELSEKNIPVKIVPESVKHHWGKVKFIKKWIQTGDFDVVHVNLFPMIYYGALIKGVLGKKCPPIVMTEHSTDNKRRHIRVFRPIEKLIYKKYDHIISISGKTQENLLRWLSVKDSSKFSVIENGIDVELYSNASPLFRGDVCDNYKEGDIILLTVGSFTTQKNHGKLIEAMGILPMNYKLLLCGEGPLEEEIKEKCKRIGITNRVSFLGFRKDVARIMHTADILVIPSIWEGFGLIAAEGMACGIPLAISDVPGLSEVVGEAGVRFNPYSPEDIKDKVIWTEQNRKGLIEKGKKLANRYSIDSTVEGYLSIYSHLMFCKSSR